MCMFWFRMNNIHDNHQASKDERFSETGREINKDIIAPKTTFTDSLAREDCQILRTALTAYSVIAALFILCIWYSSRA